MVYPVIVFGSPLLRKVTKEIAKDYAGLHKLIDDMFETMYVADGVGLAAPQIGKSIRIFVVDATPMADEEPELEGFKKAFINPQIAERSGDPWGFVEGCLSIPEIKEEVQRPSKVRIQYYDKDFNFHDEEYEGVKARIIQHEYDHLDGILFVDLLSPIRKKLLKGKLTNITKGKYSAAYKTKILK
jgi:peptide deformylase